MPKQPDYTINFQPIGKRVKATNNQSLLGVAQEAGIALASICGGVGACDSCKIRLIYGDLNDPTLEEIALFTQKEFEAGFRLACQAYPRSNLTIEIPPESLTAPQRLQIEGQGQAVQLDPAVIALELEIPAPTISDLRSDTVRLKESLRQKGFSQPVEINFPVLETLSPKLRSFDWNVTLAMRKKLLVNVLPAHSSLLGLAIDIGTTKLAAYLCDLSTGKILARAGAMNPQTAFGEDVISRISYSNKHPNGGKLLQTRLIESLNQLIGELCSQTREEDFHASEEGIVEAVVVGNTAMHHLFAGLPVQQLGTAPYVPAVSEALEFDACSVGLHIAPGAKVHMPPNIAGYVGADHVAVLLSSGTAHSKKTTIAVDVGTNTEITLAHNGQLLACSCASGPAFEGAHIQAGMRAAPGAIERIHVIQGELRNQTIDSLAPVGICGSGILDAIACMLQVGALDQRGSLLLEHPSVRQSDHKREFLLVDHRSTGTGSDIVVTRQDVNEIQLAKGAIRTGIEVLLDCAGIASAQVEEFVIAGAFGSYINIPSAIQIGMFPALPLNRFRQVGNAAGAGARQMLLSVEQRHIAVKIARRVRYIELSTYPNFTNIFSKSLFF